MALYERYDYKVADLSTDNMADHPIDEFQTWLKYAEDAGLREPNGMALATATRDGAPSVRFVLLRGVDPEGFLFYTNYEMPQGPGIGSQSPGIAWLLVEYAGAAGPGRGFGRESHQGGVR